jgi:hypothetical protein
MEARMEFITINEAVDTLDRHFLDLDDNKLDVAYQRIRAALAEALKPSHNSAMDAIVLLDRWWTRYGEWVNNGEARIELRHIIDAAQQHQ